MTAPGFKTGVKRMCPCSICGVEAEQHEYRKIAGTDVFPVKFDWSTQPHDAPCGQPCIGGSAGPAAKKRLLGKFVPWVNGVHGWKRDGKVRSCPMGCVIAVAIASMLACQSPSSHGPVTDAGIDSGVDADAGLSINAACVPTIDQCQVGLSCRITGAHSGTCQPPGPMLEGQLCSLTADCGADLACIQDQAGHDLCAVVCDTFAPLLRCSTSQVCVPFWGETGVCL